MKKAFLILLFLLSACQTNTNKKINYVRPVNDVVLFDYLNDDTKKLLKQVNNNEAVANDVLKSLGVDLPFYVLEDINGDKIDLSNYEHKKVIIEIVSTYCDHCKEQAYKNNPYIINKYPDLTFITYFVNGNKETIDAFYTEIGIKNINNNEIIVIENKEFNDYLEKHLNLKATPTYYFFNEGKMTWSYIGTIKEDAFDKMYDFAFNETFDTTKLVSSEGKSIFDYSRDIDDVKNDLDKEKYQKLLALDNDGNTVYLTLNNIGKEFDFADQYDDESTYKSEIDFNQDFSKDKIVFILINDYNSDLIEMINAFYDQHEDLKILVINVSDKDNTKLASRLKPPLASIMNQIPKELDSGELGTYPSALFIQDSIITGIYSNIENLQELNKAKDLFMGEDSIAIN